MSTFWPGDLGISGVRVTGFRDFGYGDLGSRVWGLVRFGGGGSGV